VQAEREAQEARVQLTEALAEASAARRDAARHRAAADAAVRERSGTDTERARLAAEAEQLKGEVRRLTRQLEEASSSCQAQVGREELYITSFLNRK
jgi:predicted nuclease with TOPRIM domain